MQNPHVKYLKTKHSFHLFYYEQGSILCRHYAEEKWTVPQKIAEKTTPVFSLCQYNEKAYLLYSNMEGQLFMASSSDLKQWEHNCMMDERKANSNTKFFLLPADDKIHLIYHHPTESTGVDALVYTIFQNEKWTKPYQIDRFMPMPQTSFLARRLNKGHLILYYRTGRNVISAREMLLEPYTLGSVTPLIQTPGSCSDLSIVNDQERIHLLYIVRGMFRTQVVYQYKHTSAISTPRVIWEDHNCDHCMVYLEHGKVTLMWTANGQPMQCISENNGASFGIVEKYTGTFPSKCMKAELVGADSDIFNSTECYGDEQNNFLPAVFPLSAASIPQKPASQRIPHPEFEKAYTALQKSHKQQLAELTSLLSQRSDEISSINAKWKMETEKLKEELEVLKKENIRLKKEFSLSKQEQEEDV